MSVLSPPDARRPLVLSVHGVPGKMLAEAVQTAGWTATRTGRRPGGGGVGCRYLNLPVPRTLEKMLSEAGIIVINPVPDEQLLAERMVPDRGVTPRWKAVRRRRNPLSAGTLHADYRAAPISRRAWPVRPVGCAESAPADVRSPKRF
jgi:hypothetical protein